MDLKKLGFDNWFQEQLNNYSRHDLKLARVTTVNRDNYLVRTEYGEVPAELSGRMIFNIDTNLDMPTVGDWGLVQSIDSHSMVIIHDILPRKTVLKRKDSSKSIAYQLIAANIDTAFIMQGLDSNFNINRLERYLVMVNENKIDPIILFSKCDLLSHTELQQRTSELKHINQKYPVISFSNKTEQGFEQVVRKLKPGKTYCMIGSSGVGKTTLLNKLLGSKRFAVNTVREKDEKGRHTTARRQLVFLENGAMIIDTPGMRELGNFGVETGISETFEKIYALANECRFKDCTHIHEKDCAVVKAVNAGIINRKSYENFLKIKKETEFYDLTYYEKRQRDKSFGKMCKQVMKSLRKK